MLVKNTKAFFVPACLMPNATNTNGLSPEGIAAYFITLISNPDVVELAKIAADPAQVLIVTDFVPEFTDLFAAVNKANKPAPTVYNFDDTQGVAKTGPYVAVRRPDGQVAITLGAKVPVATVANWSEANALMGDLTGCQITFNRSGLDEASAKMVGALIAARHPGN